MRLVLLFILLGSIPSWVYGQGFEVSEDKQVAYVLHESELQIIELPSLEVLTIIQLTGSGTWRKLTCLGDYILFAGDSKGQIMKLDLNNHEFRIVGELGSGVTALTKTGNQIVVGLESGKIVKLSQDGTISKEIVLLEHAITALTSTKNGEFLASADLSGTICLWKDETLMWKTTKANENCYVLLINESKEELVVGSNGSVSLLKLKDYKSERILRVGRDWVSSLDYYKDGETLAVASVDGKGIIFTKYGKYHFKVNSTIREINLLDHNELTVVALLEGGKVRLIDSEEMHFK